MPNVLLLRRSKTGAETSQTLAAGARARGCARLSRRGRPATRAARRGRAAGRDLCTVEFCDWRDMRSTRRPSEQRVVTRGLQVGRRVQSRNERTLRQNRRGRSVWARRRARWHPTRKPVRRCATTSATNGLHLRPVLQRRRLRCKESLRVRDRRRTQHLPPCRRLHDRRGLRRQSPLPMQLQRRRRELLHPGQLSHGRGLSRRIQVRIRNRRDLLPNAQRSLHHVHRVPKHPECLERLRLSRGAREMGMPSHPLPTAGLMETIG